MARNLAAFSRIPHMTLEEVSAEYDFRRYVEVMRIARGVAEGRGVIIATMHFGLFEAFAQALVLYDRPFAVIVRGTGLPNLDNLIKRRREYSGLVTFSRKGGYRQMIEYLREGVDVACMCDQNVKINHAAFANFFGIRVATTKTVALAAIRTRSPVVFCASVELSPGRYEVYARNVYTPHCSSQRNSGEMEAIVGDVNRCVEDLICSFPQQWFWIHRRFKTRPPGESEIFYEGLWNF